MTTNPLRLLGSCCVLLLTSCGQANRAERQVEQLFATWNHAKTPGAAVVVVRDGSVVYQRSYGCADLEHRIPITKGTVFDIGSTSKQFTGLAIAMLAEQGRLSLDDDIRRYLPDVPDFGKTITIGHLLHHTSGLREWGDTSWLSGRAPGDLLTMDMILEMVKRQHDLSFLPGERHQYCNTGYNLLATIVAKVTGQSFRSWMETNLFVPLGMTHTHVGDDATEFISNRAMPYGLTAQGTWIEPVSQTSAFGAGHIFTTAEDMAKWLINSETGRVGGKKAIEAIQQSAKLNDETQVHYGFGLFLGNYRGIKLVEHGGDWQNYGSEVLWLPERDFAVAILANAGNANSERLHDLCLKIADAYLGLTPEPAMPPKPAPAAKPDPASWDDYVGTYRLGPGALLEISRVGTRLLAQPTLETKVQMTPVSNGVFYVHAYGAPIEFVRDGSNAVTHLRYRGVDVPKVKLPEVTQEYLSAYVGDYWSEESRVVYRIEIRDGQLQTWHPVNGWVKLHPAGADQFAAEFGYAVYFTRDAASRVYGMTVGGFRTQKLRFVRVSLPNPERVVVEPNPLLAESKTITITYHATLGPLAGAKRVSVHRGYDGWQDTKDQEMTPLEPDLWRLIVGLSPARNQLDFCFTDGTNWDNNARRDWRVLTPKPPGR